MKPTGAYYSAYNESGNLALEMDLNGNFHFVDYVSGYEIDCKTSEYIGKKDAYKQKLEWNMFNGKELEQQVRFTVLQENCHNFGYVNNPFILEVFYDKKLLYQLGSCGTFHDDLNLVGNFTLIKHNGKEIRSFYELTELPKLELKKTPVSNMIHGRFGCRYWHGVINLLESTIALNYNIHPTADCIESPALTKLTEQFGAKKYHFQISSQPKGVVLLTLIDKYDTFVFQIVK